jgi:predicted MPP superfamily phosphohydrolase
VVRGNWENWLRRTSEAEAQYYRRCGVSFLLNQSAEVRAGVWLVGLDDPTFGRVDLEGAMKAVPGDAYRIALFHSPAFFAVSAGRYELALAGHSHGGQVRLPFLDPLWLPSGIGRFVEGWFEKDGSRMYVSRGIGMTILPIRFFCRPELAIITLQPQGK